MGRKERQDLIKEIEKKRSSKLIAYVVSDRSNLPFAIGGDTPRLFYDHLDGQMGDKNRLDLFLYAPGGDSSVPWRLVSLFREFSKEFNVLIPFRAYSAATMIALGSDTIVMGPKGELGPIDPTISSEHNPVDEIAPGKRKTINVEDLTSFFALIKEKIGITQQKELAPIIQSLTEQVSPLALGNVNRHHSFIRMVATKLLKSRKKPPDERMTKKIVEDLVERTYFHGHGIGRREAKKDLNLSVINPDSALLDLMWQLYLEYEELLQLAHPYSPEDLLDRQQQDLYVDQGILGAVIESSTTTNVFRTDVRIERIRAIPQSLSLNISIQPPPNIQQGQLNPQQLQQILLQVQQQVQQQIRNQAPVSGLNIRFVEPHWEVDLTV